MGIPISSSMSPGLSVVGSDVLTLRGLTLGGLGGNRWLSALPLEGRRLGGRFIVRSSMVRKRDTASPFRHSVANL